MENQQEKMDDLLIRYIEGNATNEEINAAREWILSSKQNQKYFDELKEIFEATTLLKKNDRFDPDKSWENVKRRYYSNNIKDIRVNTSNNRLYISFIRVAAVFIIAFLLGAIVFTIHNTHSTNQFASVYNEVIAPLGSKSRIILTDGTKVWLNAGSKLRYPSTFAQSSRDVYLEGEGYFEVSKSKSRRFIVHTSHLNIKVLGTEFNVKAYPEEKSIETTLVNGRITIENSENCKVKLTPVYLEPNQMARFQKSSTELVVTSAQKQRVNQTNNSSIEKVVVMPKVDPIIYTSWKDSRWIIQGETLENLAIKLERRYDVEIEFSDLTLKRYKFSGTLANETLEQVLNVIKITAPIIYKIENKKVYLFINNSFKDKYDKMLINQ